MDLETYADDVIGRLKADGWAGVRDDIHGTNLPDGWEQMIGPMFDDLRDKPIDTGLKAVADMSRAELHWPDGDLPSPLDQVTHVIAVGYEVGTPGEDGHEQADLTFPVLQVDGRWRIVLAG